MATKKDRERDQLKDLRSVYPAFPSGEIIDHEAPDFLIPTKSGTIGIELVDYVRGQGESGGSAERRHEELCERIIRMAQTEFEAKHDLPLYVHFFWYPNRHPSRALAHTLACSAAVLVARCIPEETYAFVSAGPDELAGTPLAPFLHRVYVVRLKASEGSLWTRTACCWPEVAVEELQELISSKDVRVERYRKQCDSVWLVIVVDPIAADGFRLSSLATLLPSIRQHRFQTCFDRVVFFDREAGFAALLEHG